MDEIRKIKDAHFYMGKMMPYIHKFPFTIELDSKKDLLILEWLLGTRIYEKMY